MSQTASGYYRKEKWYNRNIFPLVPVITIKKADEHNTNGFTFRWLFFTFWSLDAFQFELSLTLILIGELELLFYYLIYVV